MITACPMAAADTRAEANAETIQTQQDLLILWLEFSQDLKIFKCMMIRPFKFGRPT